ncbi:UNVERIFIED_CONTAM: alpha-N-arabinofuranosidase [Acetivibrio alkalicellulosi]
MSNDNVLKFKNPILTGSYPDPSICRVDNDYYMVTSTFCYFPGIPIFHSTDLVNWKQIGHVLDRPSQLNLDGLDHNKGIYAPTIRYNEGVFYVVTTNCAKGENFIVKATNPEGPWSDPYWIDEPGIDPSIFFDDDGKVYLMGTDSVPEGAKYFGDNEIWLREFDIEKMTLIGKKYGLWRGALKNVVWPEAPHIYKKDGWYYLVIAEGGTCFHHAVTVARSQSILGPYEGSRANPILTHRHLGRKCPIVNVGHADLIETQNGEWWMVLLASRIYGGYYRNMGRETFLVPLIWEDGWPVPCPESGKVEFEYPYPKLPVSDVVDTQSCDHFDGENLGMEWNFLRTPREEFWSLTQRPGYLRLNLRPQTMTERSNPSFVGRRQQHMNFNVKTIMEFNPQNENERAGLVVFQNDKYQFRFEYSNKRSNNEEVLSSSKTPNENSDKIIQLVQCNNGVETILAQIPYKEERLQLEIRACGQNYSFYYGNEKETSLLVKDVDARILSVDVAGGFTGVYIGMFASSNGDVSENYVDFDLFEYNGL